MMRIRVGDILVVAAVAASALLLAIHFFVSKQTASTATVQVAGKTVASFSLKKDDDRIETVNSGDLSFKVHLFHGQIAIVNIDCPDQICVKTGYISKTGQSIICLPNRVSILMEGSDNGEGVDIIAK